MSTLLGNARIRVRPDTAGFEASAKSSVGDAMKRVGALAATALAAGIGVGIKSSLTEASNLEQSMGAVDAVFKESGAQVKIWANEANQSVGLSADAFATFATQMGSMLKNKGIEGYTTQTNALIQLGADLAAQFGGSTADAVGALSSALRGESDPIEKYGVTINETAIKLKMAEMGMVGLEGAALEQGKTQARLAILMEQTTDAQGAFSREAGTAANAQQKLGAAWTDAKAKLGAALLPAVTSLTTKMNEAMPAVEGLFAKFSNALPQIADSGAWDTIKSALASMFEVVKSLGPLFPLAFGSALSILNLLGPVLQTVAGFLADNTEIVYALVGAYAAYRIATELAAAKTAILNAVMNMNPMAKVAIAIGALVAAVIYAWNNFEGFRNVVTGVWEAIQTAAQWAWQNVLQPVFAALSAAWSALVQGMQSLWVGVLSPLWSAFSQVVSLLWTGVLQPIFSMIGAAWDVLVVAFQIAWNTILKPLWAGFSHAIEIAWAVIKPIFSALSAAWDVVAWGIKTVWDNAIKPVFNVFSETVSGLSGVFSAAAEGIGTAWQAVKNFVAAPIKWIIDTVWNNGLLKAWNWIADTIWNGDPIEPFDTSSLSFAKGGILPGYTPGRDVHRFFSPTGGILNLSGGEAIMRPEVTSVFGPRLINDLNYAARTGGTKAVQSLWGEASHNFAKGGIFGVPSRSFEDGGLWEVPGWLSWAIPGWIEDTIETIVNSPFFDIIGGMIKKAFGNAIQWVKDWFTGTERQQLMTPEFSASLVQAGYQVPGGSGSLGGNWQTLFNVVKAAIPAARVNSAYRNTPDRHGMGKAVDFGYGTGPGGAGSTGLASIKRFLHDGYAKSLYELIYDGIANDRPDLKSGSPLSYNAATQAQHRNHVHAAVFDAGGVLNPGLTLAHNKSGKQEAVLTNEQWGWLRDAAGGTRVYNINVEATTNDPDDIAEAVVRAVKDYEHMYGRGIGVG